MIGAKKRFEVFKRDGFRCQYCWRHSKDVTLEVDHVIPKSKGGSDDFSNLITACRECNSGKWKDELESLSSKFNVKVKDLYNRIKDWWYNYWNEAIRIAREVYKKDFDGTLDQKTSWLIASFLQRWLNLHIYDKEWISRERYEIVLNCMFNNRPINHSVYELYDMPSLINEKLQDFYNWWEFFDGITELLEPAFVLRDCYFWDDIFEDWKWDNIREINERVNYNVTLNIKDFKDAPKRIIKKFSLFPNAKVEEC